MCVCRGGGKAKQMVQGEGEGEINGGGERCWGKICFLSKAKETSVGQHDTQRNHTSLQ